MSSADRLLLILHIGFAIFALGPITAATMATPRYIRRGDSGVVRFLNRMTRIYGLMSLAIFLFGLLLAHGKFNQAWLSASMTLFIVAVVLLFIVERDQRKALHKIELSDAGDRPQAPSAPVAESTDTPVAGAPITDHPKADEKVTPEPAAVRDRELAKVETGRIATLSGVVALIWIVILVLMVWNG